MGQWLNMGRKAKFKTHGRNKAYRITKYNTKNTATAHTVYYDVAFTQCYNKS